MPRLPVACRWQRYIKPADCRMPVSLKMCPHSDYLPFSPSAGTPVLLLLIQEFAAMYAGRQTHPSPTPCQNECPPRLRLPRSPSGRASRSLHAAASAHPLLVFRPKTIVSGRRIIISGREIVVFRRETGLGASPQPALMSVSAPPRSAAAYVPDTVSAR